MPNYEGNGQSKALYIEKLTGLSDAELEEEAKSKIWLSAYAANNPRSDYHWQADATYDECARRDDIEIYRRAFARASA